MRMDHLKTRNTRLRTIVLAAACAVAPAAFAQDAATTPHRFNATVGYSHMVPKSNPGTVAGSNVDLDGKGAPTVSGTWMVNDNIGVELWGAADKFAHDVNLANGGHGTIKQQPVALSGQYHFGQASQAIRPFVGLGYFQANIDGEQFDPSVANGNHVGFSTPKGAMATVGADFNITDRWFARADARYMKGDSDATVAGAKVGELQLDPLTVGVGIGARF